MRVILGKRACSRVDRAVLALVRLVHEEGWSDAAAAAELWRQGHGAHALLLARARIAAADADRHGRYGDRALATLDAALALRPLTEGAGR